MNMISTGFFITFSRHIHDILSRIQSEFHTNRMDGRDVTGVMRSS